MKLSLSCRQQFERFGIGGGIFLFILRPLGAHPNCARFVRVEGHVPFAGNVFDFVTFSYLFTQNINCVFFWDLNYRICRILSCVEFVTKSNLKRASVFGIWLMAVCRAWDITKAVRCL